MAFATLKRTRGHIQRCWHSHFYYVGGPIGGVLGLVDASEMPDTYVTQAHRCTAGVAVG